MRRLLRKVVCLGAGGEIYVNPGRIMNQFDNLSL